ncbi:MAG: FecR domain-containing protein [Candidatus Omnitrophota bacterium]|nr:FecR domain-containing protein [Candidatus Omnitrophota bacterium]
MRAFKISLLLIFGFMAVATAEADDSIGYVVEVQGEAYVQSEGETEELLLAQDDPVYENDTVTAGAASSVQIEFRDESLFSLSENTRVRLDKFVYDETSGAGESATYVAKGIFRYVSGRIAEKQPENVNIELPAGTIGMRGTVIVGEVVGERSLVALEAEEGEAEPRHWVVFSSVVDGGVEQVEIRRPGFASVIAHKGERAAAAFRLDEAQKERFKSRLPRQKFFKRAADGRPEFPARPEGRKRREQMKREMREKHEIRERKDAPQVSDKPGGAESRQARVQRPGQKQMQKQKKRQMQKQGQRNKQRKPGKDKAGSRSAPPSR